MAWRIMIKIIGNSGGIVGKTKSIIGSGLLDVPKE